MKKTVKKGLVPYLFLILVMLGIFYFFNVMNQKVNVLTYDELMKAFDNKQVTEIEVTPKERAKVYEIRGKLSDYKENETFYSRVPLSDAVMNRILDSNDEYSFELVTVADPESSSLLLILVNVVPMIILVGGAIYLFSKQMKGNSNSMDFGRSKAKLNTDDNKVTFQDVAGLKEEKQEVKELIDFLKSPKKFQKLGARIPKGVLLVGPPGTGKTLLARAVAGEANVPFYYISGSEFVELFVGVGASRVRDMFKQAKHNAPCLIFIDEIDAVGRQRGTGLGGGHDEREQTLNQLLTEMDGFGANEGIIVIAATNRADVLDPALLRPGRFDRQVVVGLPDPKEREEILRVHARNKVLAPTVKLEAIAKRTPGFSGADLENLLNEAALLAVRRDKNQITMAEVDEATDRVIAGPAKTSRKYSQHEKELVAYHEAGHAVLGLKLDDANVVQKITIIPHGQAGGYNLMLPKEERNFASRTELLDQITGLLGGRVMEEIHFHEVTTGAQNDFEKATKIARSMVTEFGMSDLGPIQLEQQEEGVFLGRDYNKTRNFSNEVAHEIDLQMRKIINTCYDKAKQVLTENLDLVKLIADALMEYEVLTKEQIDYLVSHGEMPKEEDLLEEENKTIDSNLSVEKKDNDEQEDSTLTELRKKAKEKGIKGYTKMTKEELEKELEMM